MAHPAFSHIHCSSRFDRSADALEHDLDDWMQRASVITMTEVARSSKEQAMREAGWGYWNAPTSMGVRADDCAVLWDQSEWRQQDHWVRKLHGPWHSVYHVLAGLAATTTLLKHTVAGTTMLVSVAHLPSGVEAGGQWRDFGSWWQNRKTAHQNSVTAWATHLRDLSNKKKPDAVLVVADWNLNLKHDWVRNYLYDAFD